MAVVRADVLQSSAVFPPPHLQIEAPLILAGIGQNSRVGEIMSGRPTGPTAPSDWRTTGRVRRVRRVGRHPPRRRVLVRNVERVHLVRVVVSPEAARRTVFFAEAIGGAEPRRDVLVVRLVELEALRRQGRRDDRLEVPAASSPALEGLDRSVPARSAQSQLSVMLPRRCQRR